jgi:hypothetical protein
MTCAVVTCQCGKPPKNLRPRKPQLHAHVFGKPAKGLAKMQVGGMDEFNQVTGAFAAFLVVASGLAQFDVLQTRGPHW